MRKGFISSAVLAILICGLAYGAGDPQPMAPETLSSTAFSFKDEDGLYHSVGMVKNGMWVDTIQYCWDIGEYRTPLDCLDYTTAYDSVWWQFRPFADGTLMAVQGCFHTSGTAKLFVSRYLADSCYYLMEDPGTNPNLLPQELSWDVEGNDSIWQTMDFMSYPGACHIPLKAGSLYVIGYRTDNQGHPYINWDDPLTPWRTHRYHDWRFTYKHQRVRCGDEGWDCLCYTPPSERTAWYYIYYLSEPLTYPYIMMQAVVLYLGVPRTFYEMEQLTDTYQTTLNRKVTARVVGPKPVVKAELYWQLRGSGVTDSTEMEISLPTVWGNITGTYSPGDTIDYWCHLWDGDGSRIWCRWCWWRDDIKSFVIRNPNLNADILLLNDSGLREGKRFYEKILDDLGYQYNYWPGGGFGPSVIEAGNWNTVIIFSWGANTLPGKDYSSDSLWVPFLEGGSDTLTRNILYIDQDYFCAHLEYDCDFDSSLGPGEFVYDYFGVRAAQSDVPARDTLFWFIDSLTAGLFLGQSFPIYPDSVWGATWTDYTSPRPEAVGLFSVGTGSDTSGIRYDGGRFKTVFLPFILEAAIDPVTKEPIPEADTLIHNILRWFGTRKSLSGIQGGSEQLYLPKSISLSQNCPNPFNVATVIRYQLSAVGGRPTAVTLRVYNLLGQEVRTLVDEKLKPGRYEAVWNGKSNNGMDVASGIYFYQLKIGRLSQTRKMLLLQ